MFFTTVAVAAAGLAATAAAQSDSSIVLSGTNSIAPTATGGDYATGTYQSYTATISLNQNTDSITYLSGMPTTVSDSTLNAQNQTITTNGTTLTVPSSTQTLLTASRNNSTSTGTATSSSARPTNTQPCNGYPEFCARKYSNITMVAAHNSPFSIQGNIAANQELDVTTQLNDGVRMLQFQVHKPNATSQLRLCHTNCDLLDAGLLVDYLTTVREWLDNNPYDVLTILMGNSDVLSPQNFTDPVYNSGINRYLYTPPTVPMSLDQWPTLSEMILTQHRLVLMLDYEADQVAIPWLLDEFANMWETPFSPTDRDFPCTQDRPPNLDRNTTLDRMYIANHNLNIDVDILGSSLLIPASTTVNETNAVTGYGSAGAMVGNCSSDWAGRPPNFILVDFYNIGSFNGSVFQVAADANGVSYDRDSCCGTSQRDLNNGASGLRMSGLVVMGMAGVMAYLLS
ncbi:hypothetical protein PMZ80_011067 [Knufia obscura]|uniref:PLC-like phosphodiesterase n=2 Tax=Knufia TaxID=430999 RepID=A0AAN8I3C7_9EURO|nr:hypothetical protein PMZ80_011067 [Knufia obscura]KAK5948216.1 hypothetical protein OHC33_010764 [Knufia fluminis]